MRRLGPAMEIRDFRRWWLSAFAMGTALQMLEVVIGWEVFSHHGDALDLGLIGLAEFVPLFVLALPFGQLADRVPRRLVLTAADVLGVGIGVGLAVVSGAGVRSPLPYFAFAVGAGVTMALGQPAARAMAPTLVPADRLQSAMTLRSIATQGAQIVGPAIGGVIYGVSAAGVYLVAALACAVAAGAAFTIGPGRAAGAPSQAPSDASPDARPADAPGMQLVLEGLRFVGRTPILLGVILLDLLAVLFGGAVALLPIFASRYLHVGASGLGVLRAAPAIGALLAAAYITRRPIRGGAGRLLLVVVAAFGASIIVFALSRSFALSLVALAASGYADLYSMNIRSTIDALATPDRLRGRVSAVEMVFISASNQLGAFESGLAASLVGTIPSVIGGGCVTILIALSWARLFPSIARIDRLDAIMPAAETAADLIL